MPENQSPVPIAAPTDTNELSRSAQMAVEFYKVCKDEVLLRVRVRDTLLAAYAAGAFTAIATVIASQQLGPHYLYGIPYLSLAFCLLVSYHHAGIGALSHHCATDLLPILWQESDVLAYEYSNIYHRYHRKNATRRGVAHAMILLLPAIICLVVNIDDLKPRVYSINPMFAVFWGASLLLIGVSCAVIWRSNRTHFEGFHHEGRAPTQSVVDALRR